MNKMLNRNCLDIIASFFYGRELCVLNSLWHLSPFDLKRMRREYANHKSLLYYKMMIFTDIKDHILDHEDEEFAWSLEKEGIVTMASVFLNRLPGRLVHSFRMAFDVGLDEYPSIYFTILQVKNGRVLEKDGIIGMSAMLDEIITLL